MSKLKILIVEDDLIIGAHLSILLEKNGYEVLEVMTKGEQVPKIVASDQPDVILMDIQLAGEMDGIETAKIITKTTRTPIIFLTANIDDSTFNRSKEAFPMAFLSKPFVDDQLLRSIEIITGRSEIEKNKTAPESTDDNILADRIFVKDKNKMVKLHTSQIQFIQAERNYCRIMTEKKEYILSVPLKTFEEKMSSDSFLRVHRSYLVNVDLIDELDEHYVFIKGKSVPVSKSYKKDLNNRLKLI